MPPSSSKAVSPGKNETEQNTTALGPRPASRLPSQGAVDSLRRTWPHTRCPGLPSLSEGHSLWEPAFSREGLSKLSIWLFSSLLRRRLQLESRVFLREFLRNWG